DQNETKELTDWEIMQNEDPGDSITFSLEDLINNKGLSYPSNYVTLLLNSAGQYIVKVNLRPEGRVHYKTVRFSITPSGTQSGWQVNIGDSVSNDGYGGDAVNQQNDAELQIVNKDLQIYKSDKGGSGPYFSTPQYDWFDRPITITIEDQKISLCRYMENTISYTNSSFFALNGQSDSEGPVNYDIYAAFNRVIKSYSSRTGTGISDITITLYNRAPDFGNNMVLFGHIHNHSTISDGAQDPVEAYYYARYTKKLDFFGLADHETCWNLNGFTQLNTTRWNQLKAAADKYNKDNYFTGLWGFEWSSNTSWSGPENQFGHVTVVCPDDYCLSDNTYPAVSGINTNTFQGLLQWLPTQGNAVAFLNHPGREDGNNKEFDHFQTSLPKDQVVGMELWNKNQGFDYYYHGKTYNDSNLSGDTYYDQALLEGWKIGAGGSLDNHSDAPWSTSNPDYRMAVLATANTRAAIMEALRARRFYSTEDLDLFLSFEISGYPMGSTITPGTRTITIKAFDNGGDHFDRYQIVKNGVIIKNQALSPYQQILNESYTTSMARGDYFYVIVNQYYTGEEAISSPIRIE
ncbi:MAG: CehA/McbA family metallohydrolase, partial [Spirochaetales bacterium]|nr:CehA/McbA family metallohydrolase [Spirochaetales bacterium]